MTAAEAEACIQAFARELGRTLTSPEED